MFLHSTTSLPLKPLPADPFFSFSSPIPTTLRSLNPKPYRSLVRCSASDTLPKSAIQRIADKLRSLGFAEEDQTQSSQPGLASAGEIFVPLPTQLPTPRVGHTLDSSWSTPENPGSRNVIVRFNELRNETKKQKQLQKGLVKERVEKVPTLAELTLPKEELRRLRSIGIGLRKTLKIGKAGVTEGVVNGIHERWVRSEVVKIVCDDFVKMNMKRSHDLLERKTGGLVVWRSGSKVILYRGVNYKYPYFLSDEVSTSGSLHNTLSESHVDDGEHNDMGNFPSGVVPDEQSPTEKLVRPALVQGVGLQHRVRFQLPGEAQLTEEADRLLDGLGPRFTDWWGYNPLPVDGDFLPAVIPGYRRPFRLLPYGVQPKLTNDEMTTLRRLGRPLPCHFVVGRNRKLQGLATSIVKLWEKCEIAKIAVKRGVQNTNSRMMAEELQRLTGGTMISRDKEFIVLYRGKDFLPHAVSSAIEKRRRSGILAEKRRTTNVTALEAEDNKLATLERDSDDKLDGGDDQKMLLLSKQRQIKASEATLEKTTIKLSVALEKKAKAEKLLEELNKAEIAQQPAIDKEGITEEERYMLRKVGLRMRPYLLMGRRGIFDGTIENMHLHWKYRELVKVLCSAKSIEAVQQVAQTLEAESGGILVAVERVNKGYAIIVYRGKNYVRPASLRPQTLLNKKAAMKRSIEAQRRHSLKLHVLKLNRNIDDLKLELVKDKEARSMLSDDESVSQLVGDETAVVSTSRSLDDGMDDLVRSPQAPEEDKLIDHSSQNDGNKTVEMGSVSLSESITDENHVSELADNDGKSPGDTASYHDNHKLERMSCSSGTDAEKDVSADKTMQSSAEPVGSSDDVKNYDSAYEVMWSSAEPLSSSDDVRSDGSTNEVIWPSVEPLRCSADVRSGSSTDKAMWSSFEPMSSSTNARSGDFADKAVRFSVEPMSSFADATSGDSANKGMGSSIESAQYDSQSPVKTVAENKANESHSRAIQLSNRERLLLRKQALMTRKRPVLAVGRSNVVTGVAKTIKEHFKKHPLAIVNIKGRAKGTSVQEVVFKLEQATGAVLVSQEPSKVILYRGWGSEDEPPRTRKNNIIKGAQKISSSSKEGEITPPVSPELLSAIKFECGLL